MNDANAVRLLLFVAVVAMLASIYFVLEGLMTPEMYAMISWFVFATSIIHLVWFYQATKEHTRFMNRVAESSLLTAVLFNPFLVFVVDPALTIFFLAIFAWIFGLYAVRIGKIVKLRKSGKIDWKEELA